MKKHSHFNYFSPLLIVQGRDYRITDNTMRFLRCATMQCMLIDIINDNLIEDTEMFTITVNPPRQGFTDDITISPSVATITIEDEDSMSLNRYLFRLSSAVLFSLQWPLSHLTVHFMRSRKHLVILQSVFQ